MEPLEETSWVAIGSACKWSTVGLLVLCACATEVGEGNHGTVAPLNADHLATGGRTSASPKPTTHAAADAANGACSIGPDDSTGAMTCVSSNKNVRCCPVYGTLYVQSLGCSRLYKVGCSGQPVEVPLCNGDEISECWSRSTDGGLEYLISSESYSGTYQASVLTDAGFKICEPDYNLNFDAYASVRNEPSCK